MDTQEMFRVFDACNPSVPQVQEYLERISGQSPFDLIFLKDGKEVITNQISRDLGELVGIIIDRTIFYAKGMGKNDIADDEKDITVNDIFEFGKTLHPNAKPMNMAALKILYENHEKYDKALDSLKVFGYSALPQEDIYLVFEEPSDAESDRLYDYSGYYVGFSTISSHLHFRNIFFCASCE